MRNNSREAGRTARTILRRPAQSTRQSLAGIRIVLDDLLGTQLHRFRSKLISLLRRLSPRLSRPGSKGSLQASPTICPWVQVEYSSESINDGVREDSQESDASFQRELQLNELRKRMAGIPTTSQVINIFSRKIANTFILVPESLSIPFTRNNSVIFAPSVRSFGRLRNTRWML